MARGVKEAAQSESPVSRLSHVVPLLIAAFLLAVRAPLPLLNGRFAPLAIWSAALGAALTFAGLAFCVWARFVIAGNWSGYVELKRDHELITQGPYALVRHPIYTGLLLAFIGSAWQSASGAACLPSQSSPPPSGASSNSRKLSCARQFGEAYVQYAARVPALLPFVC